MDQTEVTSTKTAVGLEDSRRLHYRRWRLTSSMGRLPFNESRCVMNGIASS
jgi:hypothetical protein